MFTALGVKIISSPLAERVIVAWHVVRHPIKKRRRNWRVLRVESRMPVSYLLEDGTVVAHPTIYEAIKAKYGKGVV